jgi:DNA-binding CsgD family transcriptional regulator/PAS domain-containing protein
VKFNSDILQLVELIYEAAVDDSLWARLLGSLQREFDAAGATLLFADAAGRPAGPLFSHDIADEAVADYCEHYHRLDIRLARALPLRDSRVLTDRDLVDRDIVDRHEFYQSFLAANGLRYVLSTAMDLGDGVSAFVSCHLPHDREHAGSETIAKAGALLPHLQRGLQLRARLVVSRSAGDAAAAVLDRLAQPVVLVRDDGRVAWMNPAAHRIIAARDGFRVDDDGLHAASVSATDELRRLIRDAIGARRRPRIRPGGIMTVERPSTRRPYQLLVTPLASAARLTGPFADNTAAAAVFINDPELKQTPHIQLLAMQYRLTPAEAKLAHALASGRSVKDYADAAGLSVNYVRWLLKQVEGKTDTRRIADLVRLLNSQPPILDDDNGGG